MHLDSLILHARACMHMSVNSSIVLNFRQQSCFARQSGQVRGVFYTTITERATVSCIYGMPLGSVSFPKLFC